MNKKPLFLVFVLVFFLAGYYSPQICRADSPPKTIEAPITKVMLFKNGLSLVTRTFSVGPAGGTYVIEPVPRPLHGTFWLESEADVTIRMTEQVVTQKPQSLTTEVLVNQLVDKQVTVFLMGKDELTGTVRMVSEKPAPGFDVRYNRPQRAYYSWNVRTAAPTSSRDNYLVLDTEEGREFINLGQIWRLQLKGEQTEITTEIRKPMLVVNVKAASEKQTIGFSYLTKGLGWAPSYRLDLTNKNNGTLTMKAVLKNELSDIKDAQVFLISGFPAVKFEQVISPLSLDTSWSKFFEELAARPATRRGGAAAMTQQVMSNVASSPASPSMPKFLTDSYDLHFEDVGSYTLKRGEAVMLQIAKKAVEYKRIVEWIIPDVRNERGRYYSPHEINSNPEKFQDAVWDAVQFNNPFSFPMTTAPLSTFEKGRFLGQTLSFWTSADEVATTRITKALNIRVRHTERELEGKRERLYIMGNDYQRSEVEGTLIIRNYRAKSEHLVIVRHFSGQLLEAEGNPTKELLAEGVYSVNERYELKWQIKLEPGKEVVLKYRYDILVDI